MALMMDNFEKMFLCFLHRRHVRQLAWTTFIYPMAIVTQLKL
jgi:hypothetical protein